MVTIKFNEEFNKRLSKRFNKGFSKRFNKKNVTRKNKCIQHGSKQGKLEG